VQTGTCKINTRSTSPLTARSPVHSPLEPGNSRGITQQPPPPLRAIARRVDSGSNANGGPRGRKDNDEDDSHPSKRNEQLLLGWFDCGSRRFVRRLRETEITQHLLRATARRVDRGATAAPGANGAGDDNNDMTRLTG
jgi:hypothetical protein